MKLPSSQTAPGTLLRNSRRSLAMLGSNRKTVKFVERLRPKHDALKKAQAKANEADDLVIDCEAAVDMVQLAASEAVTDFELAVYADVKKQRAAPRYKMFFPKGLTALKELPAEGLRDALATMVQALKTLEASDPFRRHLKPFEALLAEWKAPLQALEDARLKAAMADNALLQAKEAWLDAYVSLHGALEEAFPRQRAFVEAFFPHTKAPKKKEQATGEQPQA